MAVETLNEYLSDLILFDIETDGLYDTVTKIHCGVTCEVATGVRRRWTPQEVPQMLLYLNNKKVAGHNIIRYDIPVIKKLNPWFSVKSAVDTYVWACLEFPDPWDPISMPPKLHRKQSLEAWGHRLKVYKGDYGKQQGAWDVYTEDMLNYCDQDVVVNLSLLKKCITRDTSPMALDLEMRFAEIISRQERFGVCFNVEKALQLESKLKQKQIELLLTLREYFEPIRKLDSVLIPKRDNKTLGYKKGVPVEKYVIEEFNPNSNAQIVERLKTKYGWEPSEFTDKGNPRMDEEVLSDIDQTKIPEVGLLIEFKLVSKRLSQLSEGEQAWIAKVKPDGKIYGAVNTCGAATRRCTHFGPNLAQVPGNKAPYGEECRELFSPPEGYVQVGCDAKQLELRTLAHYFYPYDNGVYATAAISGDKSLKTDIHWMNAIALGLLSMYHDGLLHGISKEDAVRDAGKTVFYADVYGAGTEKEGRIVTKSWDKQENTRMGKLLKENLNRGLPALPKLREDITRVINSKGYLLDFDRMKFKIRSPHSALNELNQRAGAIIMKRALVILDGQLQNTLKLKPGVDYEFMLNIHDEWQIAVNPNVVSPDVVGEFARKAITLAGEFYGLKCPLDGDYHVGKNWKETH